MAITKPGEVKSGVDIPAFLADRPSAEERGAGLGVPDDIIQETLGEAFEVSREMLTGELPEDVREQIERTTAEKAVQGGLGIGQAARGLTARDIGRTSLDIIQQGLGNVAALTTLQQKYDVLKEEMRQFDDEYVRQFRETDISTERTQLAAAELVAKNQQFMQTLVNDLIIANSQREISGVQENISDLIEFFQPTDLAILDIVDIRTGA